MGLTWKKCLVLGAMALPLIGANALDSVAKSDFEGDVWGFKTANATLNHDKSDVAGNSSGKISFKIENQSGGRVASKAFDKAISGKAVTVSFDWFPGKVNDKGDKAEENGGEVHIVDTKGKTAFTLNYTNKGKISYSFGKAGGAETQFENSMTWYSVEVTFDIVNKAYSLTITDKATGEKAEGKGSTQSMDFSGALAKMEIAGVRTSGNNITWQTYLDNVNVGVEAIADNSITAVENVPYKRIYVGSAKKDIASLGLAKTVPASLANGKNVDVSVESWKAVGEWNPDKDGVYKFEGTLKTNASVSNDLKLSAVQYVYNRIAPSEHTRNAEWLDRGAVAVHTDEGILLQWRINADEYKIRNLNFVVSKPDKKGKLKALNKKGTQSGNFLDKTGKVGEEYTVQMREKTKVLETFTVKAMSKDYISIPMQKPEKQPNLKGELIDYTLNDVTVGDLTGDGQYEYIVKWYPNNAIDSSQQALTAPTIFDAYKLDGTPLWRINLGLSLTSGAHYNQIAVADFDGDGKSEVFLKTGDGTRVYGVTDGKFDENKVIATIGNAEDEGKNIKTEEAGGGVGHITGGNEYATFFACDGKEIDTVPYALPLGEVKSWGDTWYNRSDRHNMGIGYLDGVKPSVVIGRGYYLRTAIASYDLVNGKAKERWVYDSDKVGGRGASKGNHNWIIADVDNDGKDEIIAGSLTLDDNGEILYVMDGEDGRELGSHGDAIHIGQFFPEVEGLYIFSPHEDSSVASLEMHDAATGETLQKWYASKDAGRAMAANITAAAGYEIWGTGGAKPENGGSVYDVYGNVVVKDWRKVGLSENFKLYWTGDLLHELLDGKADSPLDITKYNESAGSLDKLKTFDGTSSNNSTKANPCLSADVLGDWREEVLVRSADSKELRIYITPYETKYMLYTLMHDPIYRNTVASQNNGYNQPPCTSFYLGQDIEEQVLSFKLPVPSVKYTNK